jgi:hypothetical protein
MGNGYKLLITLKVHEPKSLVSQLIIELPPSTYTWLSSLDCEYTQSQSKRKFD